MKDGRTWIWMGAVLAGLAVAAGAFAAHGLDGYLKVAYEGQTREVAGVTMPAAQKYLADFKTAADYQMSHALALLAVGLLARGGGSRRLTIAGASFLGGIVLFSGCLYAIPLTGQRWLGAVVPIGGVLFLIGWAAFAAAVWPTPRNSSNSG